MHFNLYIATNNAQWLARIEQGKLRVMIIGAVEYVTRLGLLQENIRVYFTAGNGDTSPDPWVNIDGILAAPKANRELLNLIAECIVQAVVRHFSSQTGHSPIVSCGISRCSENDLIGYAHRDKPPADTDTNGPSQESIVLRFNTNS